MCASTCINIIYTVFLTFPRILLPASGIIVNSLSIHYKVRIREAGLKAVSQSLLKCNYNNVKLVDGISFTIEPGEVVGSWVRTGP